MMSPLLLHKHMDYRSRQDALLGLLRIRSHTTVGALAKHFTVSTRTIHRDIVALRSRAIPVIAEPGRGGGVHLDSTWSIPPVRFDQAEVIGLIVAVSLAKQASTLPFGAPAQAALGKIVAALPAAHSRQLRNLCRRVLVGPPASTAVLNTLGTAPRNVLDLFEQAFSAQQRLGFHYIDSKGQPSRREVEPHGLLVQPPVWYLFAFDHDRQATRTFRLDRMSRPRLLAQHFSPQPLSIFQDTLQYVRTAPVL